MASCFCRRAQRMAIRKVHHKRVAAFGVTARTIQIRNTSGKAVRLLNSGFTFALRAEHSHNNT
ncbi:Uncharacterised protein [Vibrio cholerae]|nr:Uncharacterised protein [Vibrio cholerae]